MRPIKVILIDDHQLIRDGLRELINSQSDMMVVGEANNGTLAMNVIREIQPDIVVLDIALPDFNGLEIAIQINQYSLSINRIINVIILSMFLKESLVFQALNSGAKGYITKTDSSMEIIHAIRQVHKNRYYLSSEVSTHIIPEYLKAKTSQSESPYDTLTEREQQIFRLLSEGHSNRVISEFLNISHRTVERHRANIMSKLDLHSYHEMIKYALELGILEFEKDN